MWLVEAFDPYSSAPAVEAWGSGGSLAEGAGLGSRAWQRAGLLAQMAAVAPAQQPPRSTAAAGCQSGAAAPPQLRA